MNRRIISTVMVAAMLLSLLPAAALAADGVSYLACGENGQGWETSVCEEYTQVTADDTEWTDGWYVVNGEVTLPGRITVSGAVHLILADGCRLNAQEGIQVQDDDNDLTNGSANSLTIYAQSTEEERMGSIEATAYETRAAIGGNGGDDDGSVGCNCGTIIINGGRVTTEATGNGAGIGGGPSGGVITINGGVVTAKGGDGYGSGYFNSAAGIGGGMGGSGGVITINGGRVTAQGGRNNGGAGIGGGSWSNAAGTRITINGGEVTATGSYGSAGLGNGMGGTGGASITVAGGKVTATGGSHSAGIGGGDGNGGDTIVISGGTVTAQGGSGSVGIGGGSGHTGEDSFATGENGSAVIFAGSIGNTTGEGAWSGVIFQGDSGQVYGDVTLTEDLTVPANATLTIPEGSALTIPENVTFINEGKVQNSGTVTNNGTILDYTGWTSDPPDGSGQCINTHPEITVNISASSATYGDAVTISASAPLPQGADAAGFPAGLMARFAVNGAALGEPVPMTADGDTGNISASVTISGDAQWGTGWNVGQNTVSVEFDPVTELDLLGGVAAAGLEVAVRDRTISAPEAESVRATAVTLKEAVLEPNVGTVWYGYAEESDGEIYWSQPGSRVVSGLTPETAYYFYVKAEQDNYYQAVQAGPTEITTAAAQLSENVLYLNDGSIIISNGEDGALSVTQGSASYSIPAGQPIRIKGEGEATSNAISVQGADVTLVFDGIRQELRDWMMYRCALAVQDGAAVTLVLEGENLLSAPMYCDAAVSVGENCSLAVEGPGSLTIDGEVTTGIMTNAGSSVTVNGGVLDITARDTAIGVSRFPDSQTASISINGGSLELSGEGSGICAAGSGASGAGSVTITGGSVSASGTISPAPTDGENPLVPVTIVTGKNGAAVGDLMLVDTSYGVPARTDAEGKLTLYLPEGEYTGLAIIGGEVREIAVSAASGTPSESTAQDTGVRIETPENTKPEIQPDGNILLPEGSHVAKDGSDAVITLPAGGEIQPAEDGGIHVPAGTTVQTGDGPVITLPDSGDGGTVRPDGSVVGAPVRVGDTLITIGSMDPAGGDIITDKDGNVTLPGGTAAHVDKDGDGTPDVTVTVPEDSGPGIVKPGGDIELPGGTTVAVADGSGSLTTVTLPAGGGTVTPGENGEVSVPGGSTVETGGQTVTIPPDSSGTVAPGGQVTYTVTVTFDAQGGSDVPAQTVSVGGKAVKPGDPTRKGYRFGGWYTEAACTTAWDFDAAVSVSMTLYARWTVSSGGGSGGSTPSSKPAEETSVPGSQQFTDIASGAWYEDAVQFAVDNGLFRGISDTVFGPNTPMTRGMLATVLYRMAKEPGADGESLFSDVAGGKYYSEAVAWAAENKIVTGYGGGSFGPEDPITREQLAVILWRYAGSPDGIGSLDGFTDGDKASAWAVPALQWAVENKIVAGRGGGVLDPRGKATRAEVAAMLQRYAGVADKA